MTAIEVWSTNFRNFIDFIPNYFSTSPMDVSFELQTATGSSVRTFPNLIKQIGLNGVVNAGTHTVSTWQEAVTLLRSFNNKRLLGNVIVELPAGTLDAYTLGVDLFNTGGRGIGRIILRGAGKDVTILKSHPDRWTMFYLVNSNLTVENLTIDMDGQDNRTCIMNKKSELVLTEGTVKIKNSNRAYVAEVTDSFFSAVRLEVENCNGVASSVRSYLDMRFLNYTPSDTATTTIYAKEHSTVRVTDSNFGTSTIVTRNIVVIDSVVYAERSKLSAIIPIYALDGSKVTVYDAEISGVDYGIISNTGANVNCLRTKFTLPSDGIRHFNLDTYGYIYAAEAEFNGGAIIANVTNKSTLKLINVVKMDNISENRVNLYGDGLLINTGTYIVSNVALGTTDFNGTRR